MYTGGKLTFPRKPPASAGPNNGEAYNRTDSFQQRVVVLPDQESTRLEEHDREAKPLQTQILPRSTDVRTVVQSGVAGSRMPFAQLVDSSHLNYHT